MKPIIHAFELAKAAACLANEYRDTLYYAGLALYTAHEMAQGNILYNIQGALSMALAREAVRSIAWEYRSEQPVRAGAMKTQVDPVKNHLAASTVACSLLISTLAFCSNARSLPILSPIIALISINTLGYVLALHTAGSSLKEIPMLYQQVMWDWPRKDNDNGPTQTQKLKNWFSSVAHLISHTPSPGAAKAIYQRPPLSPAPA